MKTRKLLAIVLLCVILSSALGIVVYARWVNTVSVSCGVTFSGRVASCSGSLTAATGSTIDATLTLYKKNVSGGWDPVSGASWPKYVPLPVLSYNQTFTVNSAGTYKVTLTATVSRNGVDELISWDSPEQSCN